MAYLKTNSQYALEDDGPGPKAFVRRKPWLFQRSLQPEELRQVLACWSRRCNRDQSKKSELLLMQPQSSGLRFPSDCVRRFRVPLLHRVYEYQFEKKWITLGPCGH